MIVVAIIGILASIAIPEYQTMTLRARIAERDSIMRAIAKGVEDVTLNASGPVGALAGAYNPDNSPGTMKRAWLQTGSGWNQLPLIVEGATYCSYQFLLATAVTPMLLAVTGDCDIDGDAVHNTKVQTYQGVGHAFVLLAETPNADTIY
jgi:hypothetical protein